MLELRPNCEWCDCDLPAASKDARICSYECTYCVTCVETVLHNVCPTCGGGLTERPIRPVSADGMQKDLGLQNRPAGLKRYYSNWTEKQIKEVSRRLKNISPIKR